MSCSDAATPGAEMQRMPDRLMRGQSDLIHERWVNVPDACQDVCAGACPEGHEWEIQRVDLCGGTWKWHTFVRVSCASSACRASPAHEHGPCSQRCELCTYVVL